MANEREPNAAALDLLEKDEQRLNEAIKHLELLDSTKDLRDVTKAAAVVGANSTRMLATATIAASDLIEASMTTLGERIDAFTTATDASTKQLAKWTKVMAFATIALALFAVAQVVVAVLAWLKPVH